MTSQPYQVALEFNSFEVVPLGSEASIHPKDSVRAVKLDRDGAGRIMQFLAIQRKFEEHGPDVFPHTSF